jgi:hypothetical protein
MKAMGHFADYLAIGALHQSQPSRIISASAWA